MFLFHTTIILRHKRENLKKCSLRGLELRSDINFFTYPKARLPDLTPYLLLTIDAPPLTLDDAKYGLFLIDGTWRHTKVMHKMVFENANLISFRDEDLQNPIPFRSLPSHFQTAYPRRQDDCPEPARGLASVEALYLAYTLTGRDPTGLLDHYHWKEDFLKINKL